MAIAAACGTALSVWSALRWAPLRLDSWTIPAVFNPSVFSPSVFNFTFNLSWIAAALFAIPAVVLFALVFQPAIEIYDTHVRIGRRKIPWNRIRRLDQTGWNVPLLVYLTLDDDRRLAVLHPGDADSSASLLRHLRRSARGALLDGIPYRQFWGEPPSASSSSSTLSCSSSPSSSSSSAGPPRVAPARYPLLRPEDEAEVERMFQRLKSVGHLEQRRDSDES